MLSMLFRSYLAGLILSIVGSAGAIFSLAGVSGDLSMTFHRECDITIGLTMPDNLGVNIR